MTSCRWFIAPRLPRARSNRTGLLHCGPACSKRWRSPRQRPSPPRKRAGTTTTGSRNPCWISLADNDFDAAILGANLGGVIGGDRVGRTQTPDDQSAGGNAMGDKKVGDRVGSLAAQRNIDGLGAGGVAVAVDRRVRVRTCFELVCHLRQALIVCWSQAEPVVRKVNRPTCHGLEGRLRAATRRGGGGGGGGGGGRRSRCRRRNRRGKHKLSND